MSRLAIIDTLKKWVKKLTLKKLFRQSEWEYGIAGTSVESVNTRTKRKNKLTGEVQFILWEAGEQGHKKDYWHPINPTWWPPFIPGRHLYCAQCKSPIHRNDDANVCIECGGLNRRIDL